MKVFKYTLLAILFFVCVAHLALGSEVSSEALAELEQTNALEVHNDFDASLLEVESEADAESEFAVEMANSMSVDADRRRRRRRSFLRRFARKLRRGAKKIGRKVHRKLKKIFGRRRRHGRRHHKRRHAKKHHKRRHGRRHGKKHHKRRHGKKHHKRRHGKKHHKRRHAKKHHKRRHSKKRSSLKRKLRKFAKKAKKHARALKKKFSRKAHALKKKLRSRRHRARKARKARKARVHRKRHARRHSRAHHRHRHARRHGRAHRKHHARRHGHKFRPKHKKFGGDNGKLSKTLQKVVTTQPESATVKVGKHWAFETSVLKKLNKYVKGTPKELIDREQLIEKETHEVCGMVNNHCGSTNPKAMTNTRTCVLTKNACFKYKIALEKVRRAKKQCQNAHKMKLRDDFMGKLDAQVEVAKCLRYVKSVNYYLKQGGKKFAAARVAEVLDTEATEARTKVDDAQQELKKLKAEVKRFTPAFKACKKWVDKSKACNDRGDFGSADCAAARAKSSQCEAAGDIEYYSEAHAKLTAHNENVTNLEAERNTAETTALRGSAK